MPEASNLNKEIEDTHSPFFCRSKWSLGNDQFDKMWQNMQAVRQKGDADTFVCTTSLLLYYTVHQSGLRPRAPKMTYSLLSFFWINDLFRFILSDWLINDVIHLNYHTWSGPGIGILPPVVAFAIAPVSFLWHALSVVRRWRLVALAVLIPTPVTVIGRLSTIIPPRTIIPPPTIIPLPIWVRPWGLALRPKSQLTGGLRLTGSVRHTASVRRKAGTCRAVRRRAVRRRWRWTEVMPLRLDDVVVLLLHHRHHHLRSGVWAVAVRPVIRCDFSWDWFTSDPLQIS